MAQGIPAVITGVTYTIFFAVIYVTIAVTKTSQEDHFTEKQSKMFTYKYSYSTSLNNFKQDPSLHCKKTWKNDLTHQ